MKLIFLAFIITTSFVFQKTNSVKQFQWLEGNWKQEGKDAFEKWQTVNDTMIGCVAYHLEEEGKGEDREVDMVFDETVRLVSRGEKFFYIPRHHKQNNGKEIEFEIISFTKNSFVAENPNHDFPQQIGYRLKNEKQLYAYIEGKETGKNKRIDFRFTKTDPLH